MARRENNLSECVDMLYEITGHFWQIGVIISLLLWALTTFFLFWGMDYTLKNKLLL